MGRQLLLHWLADSIECALKARIFCGWSGRVVACCLEES
jgi:hypothetical protein